MTRGKPLRKKNINTGAGVVIISALFIPSFLIGLKYGSDISPRAATESSVIVFLATHSKFVKIGNDLQVELNVEAFKYIYNPSNNSVRRETRPQEELYDLTLPRSYSHEEYKQYKELFDLALPVASGAGAVSVWKAVKSYSGKIRRYTNPINGIERAIAVFIVSSIAGMGGYVGYLLTYNNETTFDPDTVKKTLIDPDSWKGFSETVLTCAELKRKSDGSRSVRSSTGIDESIDSIIKVNIQYNEHKYTAEFCKKIIDRYLK